ncbi:MAG: tRNA lysidine(34) synthetase TilS [Thermogutta sp.]|uniref:tRNA lysidine(34) synthetase TilS n=1 Tax=Thermogutta sp. TaxID=1962930 RepID=UPI00199F2B8C|nr:tRNA lysidine(34) synthetase TilS [Thermogutta sp.]MBC7350720.1 tRNA lysidine(34) synthetase TilS [Thermogutta sp.]
MSLHPLEKKFLEVFSAERRGSWPIVIALSGGPDSVALFHLVRRTHPTNAGPLVVVHVNHQLRDDESEEDARFCAQLARQAGVAFRLFVRPVREENTPGLGIEAAARRLRYQALREAAEDAGARYVLTGHTANDQAETILYRVFRGTGLRGLCGIPRSRPFGPGALFRPLLGIFREELLHYLHDHNWGYRCDRTNESTDFARNCIRHVIFPEAVRGVHPAAVEGVLRVGLNAQDAWAFLECVVNEAITDSLVSQSPTEVVIRRDAVAGRHPFVVQQMVLELWRRQQWPLRKLTRAHLLQLTEFMRGASPPPCRHFPGAVEIRFSEKHVILTRPAERQSPPIPSDPRDDEEFGGADLGIDT